MILVSRNLVLVSSLWCFLGLDLEEPRLGLEILVFLTSLAVIQPMQHGCSFHIVTGTA